MVKPSEGSTSTKKTTSTPSKTSSSTTTKTPSKSSSSTKPTSTPKSTTTPSKSTSTTKSTSTPKATTTNGSKENGKSKSSSSTTPTTTTTTQESINKKRTWAQVFEAPDFKTNFCGDCGNLLDISGLSKTNKVMCKICGGTVARAELVSKTIVTKSTLHTEASKEDDEEEVEMNGAIIEEACPACSHIGLFFTTAQTRGADEGQTVFYKCRNCAHKFTQNN